MIYELVISEQAKKDLTRLKRDEPLAYKKAAVLLSELREHPCSGTGLPKQLSGSRSGQWSRRINLRHRLIYEIENNLVKVFVLSAYGHYGDK